MRETSAARLDSAKVPTQQILERRTQKRMCPFGFNAPLLVSEPFGTEKRLCSLRTVHRWDQIGTSIAGFGSILGCSVRTSMSRMLLIASIQTSDYERFLFLSEALQTRRL